MTKMNPEIKQQWLTALRSGNYRQKGGRLRSLEKTLDGKGYENCHCCLGVLAEVIKEDAVGISDNFIDCNNVLTMPMRQKAGFIEGTEGAVWVPLNIARKHAPEGFTEFVECHHNGEEIKITVLNDEYSFPFANLANIIDEVF